MSTALQPTANVRPFLAALVALTAAAALTACGGGSDDDVAAAPPAPAPSPAPAPAPAPAPSPAPPPGTLVGDPAAGRARYAEICARCHSDPPSRFVIDAAGNSPQTISAAINGTVLRMTFLASVLTDQDVHNIAAYLGTLR